MLHQLNELHSRASSLQPGERREPEAALESLKQQFERERARPVGTTAPRFVHPASAGRQEREREKAKRELRRALGE